MKKIILQLCLLLFPAVACISRDYMFKSVAPHILYEEMMDFTEVFANDVKGTPLEKQVKSFARSCRKENRRDTLAWIGRTFDFVTQLKEAYPPVVSTVGGQGIDQAIRRDIMLLLDFPFHVDERSAGVPEELVKRYERARNDYLSYWRINLLHWLSSPRPSDNEIQVAKVYSSGYIFRTREHALGVDIRWDGTFEEAENIAKSLDVLLVTHPHDDHMSPLLLQAMTKRGKPVVVPCENGYSNLFLTPSEKTVYWTEGDHLDGEQVGPVFLRAAMGNQGPKIPCNVYYAVMDGWSIVAKGDNAPVRAEQYLKDLPRADFVVVPVFSYPARILDMEYAAAPVSGRTSYFLPCHENEYHHLVRGRVGYRYLFGSPDKSTLNADNYHADVFPYVLMEAGEHISIKKEKK